MREWNRQKWTLTKNISVISLLSCPTIDKTCCLVIYRNLTVFPHTFLLVWCLNEKKRTKCAQEKKKGQDTSKSIWAWRNEEIEVMWRRKGRNVKKSNKVRNNWQEKEKHDDEVVNVHEIRRRSIARTNAICLLFALEFFMVKARLWTILTVLTWPGNLSLYFTLSLDWFRNGSFHFYSKEDLKKLINWNGQMGNENITSRATNNSWALSPSRP